MYDLILIVLMYLGFVFGMSIGDKFLRHNKKIQVRIDALTKISKERRKFYREF